MVDPVIVVVYQGALPDAIKYAAESASSVYRDKSADTQLNNVVQLEVLSDNVKRFLIRGPI